jgi:hypothetical protein
MKKRNSWIWLAGILFCTLGVLATAFAITVKHEPNFYRQSQVPPSEDRKKKAAQFENNFLQMMIHVTERSPNWACTATEAEINCFFQELFVHRNEAESLRKLGISSFCVSLDGDQMRMAFRYGEGWFSTVISYELKVWLVSKEANVIAIQIRSARAGALPISCQSILHQLSEYATKLNYKVSLYRHEGTPVAIVSLQPEQPNPISTLTVLDFGANQVRIQGKTLEHALPPPLIGKGAPLPLSVQ